MCKNANLPSRVGNTFQTAWRIYRDRFAEYYRLALINSFWLFVPIYGWAKYATMLGLLARLTHSDVTNNVETITDAKRYIKPKTWMFFCAGLMSSLIFYLKLIIFSISILIFSLSITRLGIILFLPFLLLIPVISFYYFYSLMANLFLYDLPLATSNCLILGEGREIAKVLVEDSILNIQVIIVAFSLIFSFPFFIMQELKNTIESGVSFTSIINTFNYSQVNFLAYLSAAMFFCGVIFIPALSSMLGSLMLPFLNHFFSSFFSSETNIILSVLTTTLFILLHIVFGALFIPFWQSIKAVIYSRLNFSLGNADLSILTIRS